jgi:hypothetical protein
LSVLRHAGFYAKFQEVLLWSHVIGNC